MPAQPTRTTTIAAAGTASGAVGTAQGKYGSFQLPAMEAGTTSITVDVSHDGTLTWTACPVEGNEVNPILVSASGGAYCLPIKTFHFPFFRLTANQAQTSAAREIRLFFRD